MVNEMTVKRINNTYGFNLVIISMIILIMGAIMTAVIGLYDMENINKRTFATTRKFQEIDTALTKYLAKYGKFPCPAPLNCDTKGCTSPKDKMGVEKRGTYSLSFDDNPDLNSTCIVDGKGVFETVNENKETILYGTVPTASLGLSNNYLVDAWGNKIVYMIPQELTENDALKKITTQKQAFLENNAENVKLEKYLGDGEIFLLMSFNLNTPGAFPYDSQKSNKFKTNQMEAENLPINNFKLNKDNTKYLYHHKKLDNSINFYGTDLSSNTQPDPGEDDCEEIQYTYTFTLTEKINGGIESDGDTGSSSTTDDNIAPSKTGQQVIFNYTGKVQPFKIPSDVKEISIEVWGARGGHADNSKGGGGGYSFGYLDTTDENLKRIGVKNRTIYIYVGNRGGTKVAGGKGGGWNGGGGAAGGSKNNDGAGGGATDVRTVGGAWNNSTGLRKRFIVAGGGGGASHRAVTCFGTKVPENGGYGGGGNNRGGKGLGGYSEYKKGGKKYCSTNVFASAGAKNGDTSKKGVCKTTASFGKSVMQGGGGWYGGGGSYCSGFGTIGKVHDGYSCNTYGNKYRGCGSGGGGSGYINTSIIKSRKALTSNIGPGKSGGINGINCSITLKYNNRDSKKQLTKTFSGVGCTSPKTYQVGPASGFPSISIRDGEGKARIIYINVDGETTIKKTYTYTLTFPKTKYGEKVSSIETCNGLSVVNNPTAEPLDYALFSTNLAVGNSDVAINECGRGKQWLYKWEDYVPTDINTVTSKCIILPRCKKASELKNFKDVEWDTSENGYSMGQYTIPNEGVIKGTRVNSQTSLKEQISLKCMVDIKDKEKCKNDISCYNNPDNYEAEYYIE